MTQPPWVRSPCGGPQTRPCVSRLVHSFVLAQPIPGQGRGAGRSLTSSCGSSGPRGLRSSPDKLPLQTKAVGAVTSPPHTGRGGRGGQAGQHRPGLDPYGTPPQGGGLSDVPGAAPRSVSPDVLLFPASADRKEMECPGLSISCCPVRRALPPGFAGEGCR